MSVRTIEQKMGAASLWDGAAPSGGLVRAIVHNAADDVVAATKTWTFVNGAFTADDVGRLLLMGGTASGNDGNFTIAQVNSPTEVESLEAPASDETAGASPWTQDIYEAAAVGSAVIDNNMESFPESVTGGLFDFENTRPIVISQIMIKFGSGTTSWSLVLVDLDAVEIELAAASSALPFISTDEAGALAGLILLEGQALKLTSTGGPTTASRARISVDQLRG
ncbi:MAG: hypothetical protein JRG90_12565 [Deltaproteobacteria bacterium]|nr:hypothetical protein [Deltaproteobacteria bacterium]